MEQRRVNVLELKGKNWNGHYAIYTTSETTLNRAFNIYCVRMSRNAMQKHYGTIKTGSQFMDHHR